MLWVLHNCLALVEELWGESRENLLDLISQRREVLLSHMHIELRLGDVPASHEELLVRLVVVPASVLKHFPLSERGRIQL